MHTVPTTDFVIYFVYTKTFLQKEDFAMGKTSSAAKDRWNAKAYDEIKVRVPKGKKDEIKAHADRFDGGSVNSFIFRAITSQMEADTAAQTQTTTEE